MAPLNMERFKRQLEFIEEIDKLKQILRNTILMDASRRENDAEHSWHAAVCALLFTEYANDENLDMLKTLKMLLIHDLVEIDAGDTFAYDVQGALDKDERENRAADRIFGLLPRDQSVELRALWEEFEASQTGEARFAHAIDSFMPIYHNYRTQGLQWQRHQVTRERVLTRNRFIEEGSETLWRHIETMVEDAVKKGYLKP